MASSALIARADRDPAIRVHAAKAPAPAPPAPAAAAAAVPPPAPTPVTPEGLIRNALAGRNACLSVRDASGRSVIDVNGGAAVVPASTQKILIGAAALKALGPDYRFVTRIVAASPVPGVTDLYLVGGGDPGLATREYAEFLAPNPRYFGTATTPMWTLADQVRGAGIGVIGAVYADDSRYATPRALLNWSTRADEIGALGALTVNGGWARWHGARVAAPDPGVLAAGGLSSLLGVGPHGRVKAPGDAREIARVESAPLVQIVQGMLRSSNNLTAEMLVLELGFKLGGTGETGVGIRVMHNVLAEMGVPLAGIDQRDGSGLDGANKVTCRTLLATIERGGVAEHLAVAGRNGTLNRRFRGTALDGRMHGKTGWIRGAVGLTGTIDGPRPLRFALVLNDVPSLGAGIALEDQILMQLATISGL